MVRRHQGFALAGFSIMKRGFTLIEILIVLAIIGIMVTIASFGVQGAREAARDAKRKTDLENIKTSLELYFNDCRAYPTHVGRQVRSPLTGDGSSTRCASVNVYMSDVPTDPLPSGRYYYFTPSTTNYVLCAALEEAPDPALDTSGCGSCLIACNYKVSGP